MKNLLQKTRGGLLAIALVLPTMARPAHAADVAGVITQIKGAVFLKPMDRPAFRQAKKGDFVYEGTTVKTGSGDRCAISFVNGIEVKINESTVYVVRQTHPSRRGQGNDTGLQKGQMWFKVLRKGTKFQIKTPVAAVSIRGTEGDVKFDNNLRATCYEGTFNVSALRSENEEVKEGDGVAVKAGQQCLVEGGKQPEVAPTQTKETWQNSLADSRKGTLKMTLSRAEVPKGTAVQFTLAAQDNAQKTLTDLTASVKVFADREDVEWSQDGRKWLRGAFSASLNGGELKGYVRAAKPGAVNISYQSDGFESYPARFGVAKPFQREMTVEVENEKGDKKKLRLKFRRAQ